MNSTIFQNDNIFYNYKEYQIRSRMSSQPGIFFKNIEINDSSKQQFYNKKLGKENSMKNIKSIKFNNIFKKRGDINNIENKKDQNTKSLLPILNSDCKQLNNSLINYNSLINFKKTNYFKKINSKYLYLEYKKETDNEATYIEIDPHQIISSLTKFSKIKQILKNLSKKINKRNISNSDSKINIDDILMEKRRKNNESNSINNDNTHKTNCFKNDLNNNSTIYISDMQHKDYYPIQDLFLLDIINKVIKNVISLNDTRECIINEEFMLKEYKTQIKKLKTFFDEKINENKSCNLVSIMKEGNKNRNKNILSEYINKELIFKNNKSKEFFHDNNKEKNIKVFKRTTGEIYERSDENNINNKKETTIIFKVPNINLYNFDIGPKINIIDFDELLNKIHGKRLGIKDGNINTEDNIFETISKSNIKKIKFKNTMIEEKTKILKDKNKLFITKGHKYISRNSCNRKKIFIRKELFNANKKKIKNEKEIELSKEEEVIITRPNESYSSRNESDYFKSISQKEKNYNTRGKISIEKLEIKKNLGITKVDCNKTIDKKRSIHYIKMNGARKKMKSHNYSFLNTIYGKINTNRKMKINEIDYKEEIKQKGLQLLYNIFKKKQKSKLNKNISVGDIITSKIDNKKNYKNLYKKTNTIDFILNLTKQ